MILACEKCDTRYLVPDAVLGAGKTVRCTKCSHEWYQEGEKQPETAVTEVSETDEDRSEIKREDIDFQDREDAGDDDELEESPQGDLEETEEDSEDIPIPESVKPGPDEDYVPVIAGAKDGGEGLVAKLAGYVAAAVIFVAISGALVHLHEKIVAMWPESALFYDMAGLGSDDTVKGLIFDQLTAKVQMNEEGVPVLDISGKIINLRSEPAFAPPILPFLRMQNDSVEKGELFAVDQAQIPAEGEVPFDIRFTHVPEDVKEVRLQFSLNGLQ